MTRAASADVARARAIVDRAERLVVLTGAGVSAESGVPTFRGPDGLWKRHRPEELATPEAYARDPRLVWEWYGWRRDTISACAPNAAHHAIARRLARDEGARLVTQNVDGLHEAAALALGARQSLAEHERPLELHGSIFRLRCDACGARTPDRSPVDARAATTLPRCPRCDAAARPDVVWFGESLDPHVLASSFDVAERADVCLVVGTSAVVQPAASVPLATLRAGGVIVEVNPEPTPLSRSARVAVRSGAARVLPEILAAERG